MKRQRQTRPSRFSNQFQGKESSLGPPEKVTAPLDHTRHRFSTHTCFWR